MRAIKVTPFDIITVIDVFAPILQNLEKEVDGCIEIVRPRGLRHPFCMVVDGEFLFHDKPFNTCGSFFYETHKHGSPILGNILILREQDGASGRDLASLTDDDVREIMPTLRDILTRKKG